jgi:sulfur-oxidizing protein SoxX
VLIKYNYIEYCLEDNMHNKFSRLVTFASVIAIASVIGLTTNIAAAEEKEGSSSLEEGKALAFDRKKGNCLACHLIEGGDMAGNIGPPLIGMKDRFKKEDLKAQITEPRTKNPDTFMPPFGTHSILTEEEIDKVVEFIMSL